MARGGKNSGRDHPSYAGEEDLRFIRNFHDVFLAMGLILLITGLWIISEIMTATAGFFGDGLNGVRAFIFLRAGVAFGLAFVCWLLAETFSRARRLSLPSIVLFIGYSGFVFQGAAQGYLGVMAQANDFDAVRDAIRTLDGFPLFLSVVMTLSSLVFYMRMKLPFAMGALGLSIASFVFSIYILQEDWSSEGSLSAFGSAMLDLWLLAGVMLFVLGLYFDARDPERVTRLSDNGFWLHFFAAPILFFGVSAKITGGADVSPSVTLIIVGVFAFISLLINRRALLVSGILTAIFALGQLVSDAGLSGMWASGTTLVLLGGAMVLLGGAWHGLRRILVAPFPKSGPVARIIPPVTRLE